MLQGVIIYLEGKPEEADHDGDGPDDVQCGRPGVGEVRSVSRHEVYDDDHGRFN